jgi:hypothetical protein
LFKLVKLVEFLLVEIGCGNYLVSAHGWQDAGGARGDVGAWRWDATSRVFYLALSPVRARKL